MTQTEVNNKWSKLLWAIISFVVMFVLPILIYLVSYEFNSFETIDLRPLSIMTLFIAPVYSVIVGVVAGKDIKRRWILPVLSSVFFTIAACICASMAGYLFMLLFILIGASIYFLIAIVSMFISESIYKKEDRVSGRITRLIVIGIIVIILCNLLIPIKSRYLDGGTVEYRALVYRVTRYHRATVDMIHIDNVHYFRRGNTSYLVGTEVSVLGHTIYDSSHLDPEFPPSNEDEIRDFVDSYNRFQNDNHPMTSIGLHDDDVDIWIWSFDSAETLLMTGRFIIDYCEDNPDHVFNDTNSIHIYSLTYDLWIESASHTISECSISYDSVSDLLSSDMVFDDVQRLSIISDDISLTDEELNALEQIFPNAEIYCGRQTPEIVRERP
jgi:hypothetical protein